MAWIDTIDEGTASGELARLYSEVADPDTGQVDHILAIHALHPAGLRAHFELYRTVMRGTPGLRKVDRELIALMTSANAALGEALSQLEANAKRWSVIDLALEKRVVEIADYHAALRAWREAYYKCLRQWKAGERDKVWPAGTWKMRVLHGVKCVPS